MSFLFNGSTCWQADRSTKPRLSSAATNSSEDEYLTPAPPPLPTARRFDITLCQLLTCSMDELAHRCVYGLLPERLVNYTPLLPPFGAFCVRPQIMGVSRTNLLHFSSKIGVWIIGAAPISHSASYSIGHVLNCNREQGQRDKNCKVVEQCGVQGFAHLLHGRSSLPPCIRNRLMTK